MSSSFSRRIGLLITLSLILRMLIAPLGGHVGDIPNFAKWAQAISDHGLINIYVSSTANYPPLTYVLMGISQQLFEIVSPDGRTGSAMWLFFLKLPLILADALVIFLAMHFAQTHNLLARRSIRLLLVSLAFNPALIFMSGWWGQYDGVYAAFIFAALMAVHYKRFYWAGVAMGASLMIKQPAVFFIPVLGLALLAEATNSSSQPMKRAHPLLYAILGGLSIILVCLAPFILTQQLEYIYLRMIEIVSSPGWLTINALNFWFLISGPEGNLHYEGPITLQNSDIFVLGLSYRQIGIIMLLIWMLLVFIVAWRARRVPQVWMSAGVLVALGIFMWPTQAADRYSFAAVPLAGAAALLSAAQSKPIVFHHNSFTSLLLNSYALYAMITIGITFNLVWAAPPFLWVLLLLSTRSYGLVGAVWMAGCTLWAIVAHILSSLRNPALSSDGENKPDEPGTS